jgi:hypothetical protein
MGQTQSMIPLLFTKRSTSEAHRKWQIFFFIAYGALAWIFAVYGKFGLALGYLALSLFFALPIIDLDLFSPVALMAHAFGIYFFLPLAFADSYLSATLLFIVGTLIASLMLYLCLPKLNFGQARWIGKAQYPRTTLITTAISMQLVGYIGFIISTRLAGFSNPLAVLSDSVKYRFFMMVGGMTYVTELLGFLIITPAIIVAVAFYLHLVSKKIFLSITLAALFYGLATGSRGALIGIVIQILFVRHILHRRVGISLVLLLMLIVIPFIAIAGQYRMLKYANESGTLENVVSELDMQDIVKLAFSRLDASRMFNELMAAYDEGPQFGISYVELPLQVVPRAFWPDKPMLPNPEMTRIIGRDDPYLDIAFDFGIFGETYINFGWLGILIGSLIIVVISGSMEIVYEAAKNQRNPVCIITCAFLLLIPCEVVVAGLDEIIIIGSFEVVKILMLRKLFFTATKSKAIRKIDGALP